MSTITTGFGNLGRRLLPVIAVAAAAASAVTSVLLTRPASAQDAMGQDTAQAAGTSTGSATMSNMSDLILMETTKGGFVIELDREKAPISVENFITYVEDGFYDGTIFHRVIDSFMIQGGGFLPSLEQKETRAPIKNEWDNGLKNDAYTIAMARTDDPNSATSQFYINVKDNDFLSQPRNGAAYAVFGRVVSGRETIDTIRAIRTAFIAFTDATKVQRTQGGMMVAMLPNAPQGTPPFMQDVPVEDVIITSARRLSVDEAAKVQR